MQKLYIGLYLLVLTFLTASVYFIAERGWVQYRKAEVLFENYEYSQAIPYYLSAISSGIDAKIVFEHLALASSLTNETPKVIHFFEERSQSDPSKQQWIEDIAAFYIHLDQLKDAIAIYEHILLSDPNDMDVREKLAQVLKQDGQFVSAANEYRIILQKYPLNWEIQLQLARALSYSKQYDEAIDEYEKIVKETKDSYVPYIELVNSYLHVQDYKQALSVLEEIPVKKIDDSTLLLLADLLFLEEKNSEAKIFYQKYLDKKPDDISAILKYAVLLCHISNYDAAIAQYEKILQKKKDPLIRRQLAMILLKNRQKEKAIIELDKSLKEQIPTKSLIPIKNQISSFDARYELAKLYAKDPNQLLLAIQEYEKLLIDHQKNPKLHYELGNIYLKIKRFYLAKKEFELSYKYNQKYRFAKEKQKTCLPKEKIDPNQIAYLSNDKILLKLAQSYANCHQYDKATKLYRHLIQRTDKQSSQFWVELGDILLLEKHLEEALFAYQKAFEIKPTYFTKKKFAFALSWNKKYEKSKVLLEELEEEESKDKEVLMELARVSYLLGDTDRAKNILDHLAKEYPKDPLILFEMAKLDVYLGHAIDAKEKFYEIFSKFGIDEKIKLSYAHQIQAWGDFYKAEKIYRNYLTHNRDDFAIQLRLAWLLTSTERYEEAEEIYKQLLLEKVEQEKALLGLAKTKLLEKDFNKAIKWSEKLLEKNPKNIEAKILRAKSFVYLKKFDEALLIYQGIEKKEEFAAQALIAQGKIYEKLGFSKKASENFEKAYAKDPSNISAQFYLSYPKNVSSKEFLSDILLSNLPVKELQKWASLYSSHGWFDEAIILLENAKEIDPKYFPAKMELAQVLGINHNYQKSLKELEQLEASFQDDYKILLWQARVSAWGQYYDQSFATYEKMRKISPNDPVALKEMARTAIWAKKYSLGFSLYKEGFSKNFSEKISKQLDPILSKMPFSFKKEVNKVYQQKKKEPKYLVWEEIDHIFHQQKDSLDDDQKTLIRKVLIDSSAAYKLEKFFYLEFFAKKLSYDKRFAKAKKVYNELLAFQKGNQEAIFDTAQIDCIFGLCDESKKRYKQLLNIDPLHSRANEALELNKIHANPFVSLDHFYWTEEGRGDIDRITENRTKLTIAYPFQCKNKLFFKAIHWEEKPDFQKSTQVQNQSEKTQSFPADGYGLAFETIFNPYVKSFGGFSQRFYRNGQFPNRNNGHFHLLLNCDDYVKLDLGYDRLDELDNYFGLRQGVQYNQWIAKASANITRRGQIELTGRYWDYNDDNSIAYHDLDLKWAITDHPMLLQLTLHAEYRHSKNVNIFFFDGPFLENIIHPYWTPKHYYSYNAYLKWYHDLSKPLYCGNQLHYYEIKLKSGYDTEKNPMFSFEAKWHLEFAKHWTAEILGSMHQSDLWVSQTVWANLKYQF